MSGFDESITKNSSGRASRMVSQSPLCNPALGVQDGYAVIFLTWRRSPRCSWGARVVGRLQHPRFTGKGVKAGTQHEEESRGGSLLVAVVLVVVGYFVLPGLLMKWATGSERKAASLQYKSVHVGDHEIVYLEGGHGETILMLHGFAANKDNWTRFAKLISPAYHVVALDLPGFGESTCLEDASYSIADQAKRLTQFADAIGLKKFHIVGNSMGGHIAARVHGYVSREGTYSGTF